VDATPRLLFEPDAPDGFVYLPEFVTAADEAALVTHLREVAFANFEMRGVVARRRVAFFGESYIGEAAVPMPHFLLPLRAAFAEWARVEPDTFAMALVNEYRPGAPIGWHRDAPQYDLVAGLSLRSPCRMKFRPYERPHAGDAASIRSRRATHQLTLEPRSAYLMTGAARQAYEHHIPAVEQLRYSITFRTKRDKHTDKTSSVL
jgi:alkylated DNA repair dioxygenase AlkB